MKAYRNPDRIINFIIKKGEVFWSETRKKRPLKLFHLAAERVPAYKDFLKRNGIHHEKIKTFKDFQLVPTTSKKDYLRRYPLEMLCWDGSLRKPLVFTATSGSMGKPFYFVRGEQLDWEASIIHRLFLENGFRKNYKGPTLVVVSFGMGVWIGGLLTYKAFEIASRRADYPVSIITPGINKSEIFNALEKLSPHYEQTILAGYPPFIKDIIDESPAHSINLKKLNIRILNAAEAYTEKFRDYLVREANIKNLYLDTLNIYGTADIGTMAWETPTSILIRRLTTKKKKLFESIFSPIEKTPTLCQYNPLFITFESLEEEIILTGDNAIPLIRYAVGDHGGVFNFSDAVKKLKEYDFDFREESKNAGIQNFIYQLPFVYVYERVDLSTTIYGLQIYPETVREALMEKPFSRFLTGKLTMLTKFNKNQDQYLEINLELRKNKKVSSDLKKSILKNIVFNLRSKNSEFRELSDYLGKRALPKLVFRPAEHPLHFKPGIKQRWVKKNQ